MPLSGFWDTTADPVGWYEGGVYEAGIDEYGHGQASNGLWYYNGSEAQGWVAINGVMAGEQYYIAGTQTTLDSNGSGAWNGTYYLAEVPTTLDLCGNGTNGVDRYIDGSPSDAGYSTCAASYWIIGQETTLDQYGNGLWSGAYYLGGQETTLDDCGTGNWNGTNYIDGQPQDNGWSPCASIFYMNGQATTLDSSGSGTWNGTEYSNQMPVYRAAIFTNGEGTGDFSTLANWTTASGAAADTMPAAGSSVTITGAVTSDSNQLLTYTGIASITITGNGSIIGTLNVSPTVRLTVRNNGSIGQGVNIGSPATFLDQSSATSATFGSDVTLRGDSFLDGCTFSGGTLRMYDNARTRNGTTTGFPVEIRGNAANVNGFDPQVVTVAHGGGINGSNILGFA